MQLHVDGQAHLVARRAVLAVQLADDPADGVHLHLHLAGVAAQILLVEHLHPRAADAHARQGQHGVVAEVRLARRCDVAHDVGQVRAERVVTRGADVDDHAGQVRRVHLDAGHLVPVEELLDGDRDETAVVLQLALDAGVVVVLQRHKAVEGGQRGGDVGGLLGQQQSAPVEVVAGEHLAETVDDAAAGGGDQASADAVALGERGIFGALLDLDAVELHRQRA